MILADSRSVIVAPLFYISALSENQLVTWDSAPGVNYQVLATTNLSLPPFEPISPIIQGSGASTFYFDDTAPVPQKFYKIQVAQ